MKRLIILFTIILLNSIPLLASVMYVSGDVWGVWSADTVLVSDSARVPPDSTLIIQPGVKVLFWDYCKFIVDSNATLRAMGTEQDTILFDEYWTGNRWKGIRFLHASDSSRLEYCHITHGYLTEDSSEGMGAGIYCNNSIIYIKKCLIDTCFASYTTGAGGGIACENNSNVTIDECYITHCCAAYGGGIGLWENCNGTIINSTIIGNWCHWSGGGINIDHSNPYVYNNQLIANAANDNVGGGIVCWYANATIDSNIIIDNYAEQRGGGIYCGYSDPIILNNTISHNTTTAWSGRGGGIGLDYSNPEIYNNIISNHPYNWNCGGAIYCSYSNPNIYDNNIFNNTAEHGGGIYCEYSNPNININNIMDNYASWDGGGIVLQNNSNPEISHNIFNNNFCSRNGGVMYCSVSSPRIISCIFDGNIANNGSGGAIHFANLTSHPTIISNIFKNNTAGDNGGCIWTDCNIDTMKLNELGNNHATNYGGGIYFNNTSANLNKNTIVFNTAVSGGGIYCYNSSPQLINSIVWGNLPNQIYQTAGSSIQATYSDIQQIWPGVGNIIAYPLFADTANADYHLTWANFPIPDSTKSPCIDTGNPNVIYNDPDGTRADMGCYYFNQGTVISVSPLALDFAEVAVGNSGNLPLTISNIGLDTLILYDISSGDSVFSTNFNTNDSLVTPGGSLVVTVYFRPACITAYNDTLTILSNCALVNIPLSGTGIGPISLTLTPQNPPIVIPPSGGNFVFNIACTNLTSINQTFDLWTIIQLPNVGQVQILNFSNLILPPTGSVNRDRTQIVPGFAPAGNYTYFGYVGDYPWIVENYDSFTFLKQGANFNGVLGASTDWPCSGEPFPTEPMVSELPAFYALHSPQPNPFNPTTKLTYSLPVNSEVSLVIYDLKGREVVVLADGFQNAGIYETNFDGSNLPSGVYFARLTAGNFRQTQKLLLIK